VGIYVSEGGSIVEFREKGQRAEKKGKQRNMAFERLSGEEVRKGKRRRGKQRGEELGGKHKEHCGEPV